MKTLLCNKSYPIFCKLFDVRYQIKCNGQMQIVDFTIEHPILILICCLSIIMSFNLCWMVHSKMSHLVNGKVDYMVMYFLLGVWYFMYMIDHCIFIIYNIKLIIVILVEVFVLILFSFSLLNASLIEFTHKRFSNLIHFIRPIVCGSISLICIIFIFIGYQISSIMFEVIWLCSVFLPIFISLLLYLYQIICLTNRFILIILFIISSGIGLIGIVVFFVYDKNRCNWLSQYLGSEEILMTCIISSMWLFFRFFKKHKEELTNGKKIGQIEIEGKVVDVELEMK
ncbi:hypothetical protein ENUP19_0124G0025 [Entamoeba nuttalli]